MLPVLVASILLCLPSCWAGDVCPPKMEMKTCTCRHFRFKNKGIEPQRLRLDMRSSSMIIPSDLDTTNSPGDPETAIGSSNLHPTKPTQSTATSSSILHPKPPPTHPPEGDVGFLSRSRIDSEDKDTVSVKSSNQFTTVDCKSPKSVTDFEEILVFSLHRRLVDKLIVSHLPPFKEETLARLPSRGMRNTRIKQFEIRDSPLSGDFIWNGSPFDGQANSLLRIAANRCYLYGALTYEEPGTVNTKGLNQLPRVEAIDFSSNLLTVVKATAFRYSPANLSTITLSRNSLQLLDSGSFQNVPHLKIVDLSHNLLKTVLRTIFAAPAKNLETINLSENFIETLPVDFFTSMPALRIVNMARNFLYSISEKPWSMVWTQLTFVDVTGNFVYCDCQVLWLLAILSPSKPNVTSTPTPAPLVGQTIKGHCSTNRMPDFNPVEHNLVSLTRSTIVCR